MNSTKHTPGPWVLFGDGELRQLIIMPAGRPGEIAAVQFPTDTSRDAEYDANAHLIAAAPELLAALKAVVAVADRRTDEFDAARAAIAKATGETK